MDILIITDGPALGFADRLTSEGHFVSVFSRTKAYPSDTGFYDPELSLMNGLKECKFAICDVPAWDYLDKRAKYYNRAVIGSNALASVPNKDAVKQYRILKRFDVPTARTEVLDDLGEAIEHILHWNARSTVIKYQDVEFKCDYRDWLSWGLTRVPLGVKILFQELSYGTQTIATGWFDGISWLDAFSIAPRVDFELYKYAAIAPLNRSGRIVSQTFNKLTPYFKQLNYQGPVHLDMAISEKSLQVDSMHVGWDFPLDYTILELLEDELSQFLNGVALANDFKPSKTKDYVGIVQTVCVGEEMAGAPILGINPERLKHLVFHNVTESGNDYQFTGIGKEVITATAHGRSISEMCERVYTTAESVKFPEKHLNPGLANSVGPAFEQLKSWKYINGS